MKSVESRSPGKGVRLLRGARIVIAASAIFSSMIAFQNCSNIGFDKPLPDFDNLAQSSSLMSIEGGRLATNKKIVSVQFSSALSREDFAKVRLSMNPDMGEQGEGWQDFTNELSFDFAAEYDKNGNKDGVKTVYAELAYRYREDQPMKLSASIGLDTLVPVVQGQGVLAKGLQGAAYAKGQSVGLNWSFQDSAAPSGYSSGVDPREGMKVGYSSFADCSNQVTWITDWRSPSNGIDLAWPTENPLDPFYVCVQMKDLAGNEYAMLSQPMVSLWRVFAGDNNQGNGGSVKAPNVRFAYPSTMTLDGKGNLFILDSHFNNIRRVSKDGRIGLVIGTGPSAAPSVGKALNSTLNVTATPSMATDSKDRVYVLTSNGGLFRLIPKADDSYEVESVISGLCASSRAFDIVKNPAGDTLYLHHWCTQDPAAAESTALNYLIRVPIADFDKQSKPMTRTEALAYKFLGNGRGLKTSDTVPTEINLGKNDPSGDTSYSLGSGTALKVSSTGAIYIATTADGNNRGWDHHGIRMLTDNGDGTWKQRRLLSHGKITWIYGLTEDDPDPATKAPRVLVSSAFGFFRLQAAVPAGNSDAPFERFGPGYTNGVFGITGLKTPGSGRTFFGSIGSMGKIAIFDASLNEIDSYGRPVYSESDTVATEAMLNQPEGIFQSAKGNTYIVDTLNSLIRKVDSNGRISTLAGQPGQAASRTFDREDLSKFTYNGMTYVNGGYYSILDGEYDPATDQEVLYMGNGATTQVHRLDLKDKKVTTIAGTGGAKAYDKIHSWTVAGITLGTDSTGRKSLFLARYWPLVTPRLNGGVTQVNLNGDRAPAVEAESLILGNTSKASNDASNQIKHGNPLSENPISMAPSIRQDSTGYVYVSGSSGFQVFLPKSNSQVNVVSSPGGGSYGMGTFTLFEDGTKRQIFGLAGNRLVHFEFDVSQLDGASALKPALKYLCLPGSFWNSPRAMTRTVDGNLLISDGSSGRVLEYFLRDSSGKMNLSVCP